MKCEDYQEWLSLYVDDVLMLDEKQQLEQHLEHCLSCRETLETLLMMKSFMQEIKEVEVPEMFHNDLHKRLQEEVKPKNKKYKWLPYASGLVAACLIGFVLLEGTMYREQPIQEMSVPMMTRTEHNRARSATLENEMSKQSRVISTLEEVWQVNCNDLMRIQNFIENYAEQNEIYLETWEEGAAYHFVLEPIEDKEAFKQKLQLEKGIEGTIQITEEQTSRIHLILSIQE